MFRIYGQVAGLSLPGGSDDRFISAVEQAVDESPDWRVLMADGLSSSAQLIKSLSTLPVSFFMRKLSSANGPRNIAWNISRHSGLVFHVRSLIDLHLITMEMELAIVLEHVFELLFEALHGQ